MHYWHINLFIFAREVQRPPVRPIFWMVQVLEIPIGKTSRAGMIDGR